jgi:hypothetical protein
LDSAPSSLSEAAPAKNIVPRASLLTEAAPTIDDYINSFQAESIASYNYSSNPVIESILAGEPSIQEAFVVMKKASSLVGPVTNIGGEELDQAERAIFAVCRYVPHH